MAGLVGPLGYSSGRRKQAMLFLYKEGYQFQQIGELFGISKQRVHKVIGEDIDGGYLSAVSTEREELVAAAAPLLREGLSRAEVAEELKIPIEDLNVLFTSARKARSRGRRPAWATTLIDAVKTGRTTTREVRKSTRATIALAIRGSKHTLSAIAKKSGLSYSTVKALAKAGAESTWSPSPEAIAKLAKVLPTLKRLAV